MITPSMRTCLHTWVSTGISLHSARLRCSVHHIHAQHSDSSHPILLPTPGQPSAQLCQGSGSQTPVHPFCSLWQSHCAWKLRPPCYPKCSPNVGIKYLSSASALSLEQTSKPGIPSGAAMQITCTNQKTNKMPGRSSIPLSGFSQ